MIYDEFIRKIVETIDEDRRCNLEYMIENDLLSIVEEMKNSEYEAAYADAKLEYEGEIECLNCDIENLESENDELKDKVRELEERLEDKDE